MGDDDMTASTAAPIDWTLLCPSCRERAGEARKAGMLGYAICAACVARGEAARAEAERVKPPAPLSPGPWRWKLDSEKRADSIGYISEMPALLDRDGKEVCHFGDDTQYYPSEGRPPEPADAALIAAAPEMLALLDQIADFGPRIHGDWWTDDVEPRLTALLAPLLPKDGDRG